ncbi:uncharacterized protein AMSG_02841 [Thecamonas trahens ATCC 50062]|uniref:FYVE-type domain-containing protein n=1 Tax=Thecamonas trahens ATCC 50062 TaxID=461836 RepID=A0A0L0D509_THETB|nr:hypothetical protein AMSG_02841 [Thecamonas trahens ATCC 50062]KNC46388.1 hypothetical protein AMSG_02841 [Thecamonas trahens ATCC 50062]|eukprot:XP_013760681.1 hypothetical protein AMSG_02841 [Thecamonas trahens ATCC 50062]
MATSQSESAGRKGGGLVVPGAEGGGEGRLRSRARSMRTQGRAGGRAEVRAARRRVVSHQERESEVLVGPAAFPASGGDSLRLVLEAAAMERDGVFGIRAAGEATGDLAVSGGRRCTLRGPGSAVHAAAEAGDVNALKQAVREAARGGACASCGGDGCAVWVDAGDEAGRSPLMLAVLGGHSSVALALFEAGADIDMVLLAHPDRERVAAALDQRTWHGRLTPLALAVLGGHTECVKRLVADGRSNMQATTSTGASLLHVAVLSGNVGVLDVIMKADDVPRDSVAANGLTALQMLHARYIETVAAAAAAAAAGRAEVEHVRGKLKAAEAEFGLAKTAFEVERHQIQAAAMAAAEAAADEFEHAKAKVELELKDLRDELGQAKDEAIAATEKATAAEAELGQVRDELGRVKAEAAAATEKATAAEAELGRVKAEAAAAAEKATTAEAELSALRDQLEHAKAAAAVAVSEAESEPNRAKSDGDAMAVQLATLQAELWRTADGDDAAAAAAAEIARLKAEAADTTSTLAATQAELGALHGELARIEAEHVAELAAAADVMAEQDVAAEVVAATLNAKLAAALEKAASLKDEVAALKGARDAASESAVEELTQMRDAYHCALSREAKIQDAHDSFVAEATDAARRAAEGATVALHDARTEATVLEMALQRVAPAAAETVAALWSVHSTHLEPDRWRALLDASLAADSAWVPDSAVSACQLCNQPFGLFRRRHHCRVCLDIFCATCSSHTIVRTIKGEPTPLRCCDACLPPPAALH